MFSFDKFDVAGVGNSKIRADFYGKYGYETFFQDLVRRELNSCRLLLLDDFKHGLAAWMLL